MYAERFDKNGAVGGSQTAGQLNLGLFDPMPEPEQKLAPKPKLEPKPAPQVRAGMVLVSREEFFAYIGPRDISPSSQTDFSEWITPSRVEVGRSYPGYKNPRDPVAYMLTDAAYAAIKGK